MEVPTLDELLLKWNDRIRRGFLRLIILGIFQAEENDDRVILSGSSIIDNINKETKSKWIPSPGSVYPILAEMEGDELIEEIESTNRKNRLYKISKKGQQNSRSWMWLREGFYIPYRKRFQCLGY